MTALTSSRFEPFRWGTSGVLLHESEGALHRDREPGTSSDPNTKVLTGGDQRGFFFADGAK